VNQFATSDSKEVSTSPDNPGTKIEV
jgi:hypothetical protein